MDWVQIVLIVVVASSLWGFFSRFTYLLAEDLFRWWKGRTR